MTEQEKWIQAAWENFREAADQKDINLMRAVIADLRQYGHETDADIMEEELKLFIAHENNTEDPV